MESGGRKLTYAMMVAVHNWHVEYGHCTAQQMYKHVLNNVGKVNNGLWDFLAIPYVDIRIMEDIVMVETLPTTLG